MRELLFHSFSPLPSSFLDNILSYARGGTALRRRLPSSSSSFGNNNVTTAQNYIPLSEDSAAKSFLLDLLNLGQLQPAISSAKEWHQIVN